MLDVLARRLALPALALVFVVLGSPSAHAQEVCGSGLDDDGDGFIDCSDPDCDHSPVCSQGFVPENTPVLCRNGQDDDGDGEIDCDDAECAAAFDFCVDGGAPPVPGAGGWENTTELCSNRIDDDNDGLGDCADPDCLNAGCAGGQPGSQGIYQPRRAEERVDLGYREHDDPRRYSQYFVEQPLTLLRGMFSPGLGLTWSRLGNRIAASSDPTFATLSPSFFYGLFDFWEIGIEPLNLQLNPATQVNNPAIVTTFRLGAAEAFEGGLRARVGPGLRDGTSTFVAVNLPLLLRAGRVLRVDLIPIGFASNLESDFLLSGLLNLTFNAGRYVFFGVGTGYEIDPRVEQFENPTDPEPEEIITQSWQSLRLAFGATIPGADRGPVAQLGLELLFPRLNNFDTGAVDGSNWQVTLSAVIFTYLTP